MPENFAPAYGIIKGRFKAVGSNTFGIFFVMFSLLSKNVEKIQIASSHFSSIYDNSPQMSWHDFEERIVNLKWKGEYSINITNDIQKAFDYEFKSKERVDEITYFMSKGAIPKITEFFQNILQRPTGDRNVSVDIEIEMVAQDEIEEVNIKRIKKDQEKKTFQQTTQQKTDIDEFNLAVNSVVLESSLVLSPVTGIPIYELKPGDKVLTRITEKTQRGQYFRELLGSIDPVTNEERPIPAVVEQIKVIGKNYVVLTNIGPSIYGKSIEEDNVKVKKYEGQIFLTSKQVLESKTEDISEDKTSNLLIFLGIAAGTLLIVVLILTLLGIF